ncbi:hypothetical protein CTAYLR_002162 [Chrysophaeum taylorii]|uniref:acetylglutamate kinase n=1 Tax=Chrysophaeum taylorii TaxID=2483200 RepID=A0AAD7XQA9_9STRA|nr:hypothetical protein CTAYLR_002162 [Chrysophaeum taylorii]
MLALLLLLLLATEALRMSISGPQIYESLSHFGMHAGKTVVVKYGGHAMSDEAAARCFAQDIVLLQKLGVRPVVVHGGGPQIGNLLSRLNVSTSFVDGLRITDAATVEVAEMVLSGTINKQIAAAISAEGGHALGLSGRDDSLIVAERLLKERRGDDGHLEVIDLGFVGEPKSVNAALLVRLLGQDVIPVVAPIATGRNGETFSVNADTAAGAVAQALGASRLLLLTDVPGVLDARKNLLEAITPASARDLIADGIVRGGMIPKLQTAVTAVNNGVDGAAIVDGRVPHAVLLELFSEKGAGTLVSSTPPPTPEEAKPTPR